MPKDERASWDRRYGEGSHHSFDPDPFLVEAYEQFIAPLFPQGGVALDLAGGTGRHSIYLAQRGWRVTLNDISEVGLAQARPVAADCKLHGVEFAVGDTRAFDFGRDRYDLVLVFFYLERDVFGKLHDTLRPGGLLVYKTYTQEHLKYGRGPTHPMHFLQANELLRAFSDLRVLFYRETVKERGVAELIAQR